MLHAQDRSYTRRDTWLFLGCIFLSLVGLFGPDAWGYGIASALRTTVLSPVVWLQARAEEGRTSRARFRALTTERDSVAIAAQFLPALRAENIRLRELLELSRRLTTPYVAAEVLHQAQATDGRTLLLNVGHDDGVSAFDPIVAPEGLLGLILQSGGGTSVAMTWAHPEFRVSAFTEDGKAFGIVAPSSEAAASESFLELRGVPYRDTVPDGTLVLSSGLGGVYPKGIPLGVVTGVSREQRGWERVYRLRPAAHPSATPHVLVLVVPRDSTVTDAFPSDSILAAMRADSLARQARADSLLRGQIADSVRRALVSDSAFRASLVPPQPRPSARPPAQSPPPPPTPTQLRPARPAPRVVVPADTIRRPRVVP